MNSVKSNNSLDEQIAYAEPYLIKPLEEKTEQGLAKASVNTLLSRLKQWQTLIAKDGKPVLDSSIYNEWVYWHVLGYGAVPYDIVLTNQLIASAEYFGQTVGSAIRGGVVTGTTSYNKNSPYGTYVFYTTFVFENDFDWVVQLRGNHKYDDVQAAKIAGAYLTHEIGHQLLHFAHPTNTACVMYVAELLKYHEWYEKLSSKACPIDSTPQMKKGAEKFKYVNW